MASFKKLKTGWQYRISYKDGDKYRTKNGNGFSTKREAQIAAAKVEDLLNKGNVLNENIIFMDYYENWYLLFRKDKYSAKNNYDIEHAIRQAKKFFKHTKILDIDRTLYQKFINWYGKNRATATVSKVHVYARACLQDAFQEGIIYRDPTHNVKVQGTKKAKDDSLKFLSEHEVKKLIVEIKNGMKPTWSSRYMILLALATGLRFSEVIALAWEDINFKEGYLNVNKSFDHVITKDFVPTKTDSSRRVIAIDKDTLSLLREYKIAAGINGSPYIFLDNNKNHTSNTATNQTLRRACNRAGIQEITFHSLRHTHCSLLIYRGVNIKYISKRLGHANITTTYQTYGHILDEMEQRESSQVEKIMLELYNAN